MNYELLSNVAQIIMGQSPPSSTYNTVGEGLPFYQGKTDFGEMYPMPRVYCTEPSRIAEPDDILISVRAPVGPTNISRERSCIGRGISAIRAGKNIDRDFLLYFLRFYEPELAKAGTGSTFAAIAREDLETIKLPLPPLTEQKRIASLLARADRLCTLRRTAHELGESLLQSVFLEMFGDPIKNNPNGYEICELKDVCNRITDGTHQPPEWAESGIPFLFVSNVVDGELTFDTQKFISDKTWYELQKRCPIELNDILYTIVGSYGNAALVKTTRKFSFQRHIAHVKPNPKKILPVFLLGMMQSIMFREQVEQQVRGVAQKTLNLGELQEIKIFVPPLSLQEEFAGVVARVESLRGRMSEAARQVEGLFDALLAESFREET